MLDVVCLDLMGTVVYDPYLEALEAATGLDLANAQAVKNPDSWPQFELGAIDEAEFVRRFFIDGDAGHRFDIEAFHRVRREGYHFLPGMTDLLRALDGHVDRYVASNYPVWIEELHARFDFDQHFEGVFVSCRLGVRKPDPAFFEAMLDSIAVPASRCLFVDDRRLNCEAAASVGMRVHVFHGAAPLRRRLHDEGLPV
ncbi:MAG: HAD-IA family hydrolase [Nitriliruptorales bacterium]|nr:HAD-IA family hydrolase [Nitriliruptorales bacterium]